jgi:hypothetical protein
MQFCVDVGPYDISTADWMFCTLFSADTATYGRRFTKNAVQRDG